MKNETFPMWLRRQLERREWNQRDLARRMEVHPGLISHWIRGQRVPTPESCELLADTLNVDLDEVLTVVGHRQPKLNDDDALTASLVTLVRKINWTERSARPIQAMLEQMTADTPRSRSRTERAHD